MIDNIIRVLTSYLFHNITHSSLVAVLTVNFITLLLTLLSFPTKFLISPRICTSCVDKYFPAMTSLLNQILIMSTM